jgi:hypothetical protein
MESLSWIFFCLSPFALFCSENGNGLILCPVFILLGFVFKWAGNNSGGSPTAVVKVEPQKFWEWHYKDRMRSTLAQKDSINDGLMALKDKEARSWATTICGYHNAWVPPEGKQEQIARACGVTTEKMIKKSNEKKDKIQVGKYLLMKELMEKHDTTRVSRGERSLYYYPKTRIKKDIDKIKASNDEYITEYWAYSKYKKSVREIWDGLSEEEKNQAARWVEEYERRLIDIAREYAEKKRNNVNIDMDF